MAIVLLGVAILGLAGVVVVVLGAREIRESDRLGASDVTPLEESEGDRAGTASGVADHEESVGGYHWSIFI